MKPAQVQAAIDAPGARTSPAERLVAASDLASITIVTDSGLFDRSAVFA